MKLLTKLHWLSKRIKIISDNIPKALLYIFFYLAHTGHFAPIVIKALLNTTLLYSAENMIFEKVQCLWHVIRQFKSGDGLWFYEIWWMVTLGVYMLHYCIIWQNKTIIILLKNFNFQTQRSTDLGCPYFSICNLATVYHRSTGNIRIREKVTQITKTKLKYFSCQA